MVASWIYNKRGLNRGLINASRRTNDLIASAIVLNYNSAV